MHKKILLSLMFLPILSSSKLLSMELPILFIYGAIANIVTPLVNKAIEIYCPNAEQEAANAEANEHSNYINSRIKFRNCVLDSKPENEKTSQGIPVTCKELARIFVAAGGKDELIKIISDLEELDN